MSGCGPLVVATDKAFDEEEGAGLRAAAGSRVCDDGPSELEEVAALDVE